MEDTKFETWALVELFGHTKIAGHIQEQKFGSNSMLLITVPPLSGIPEWSKIVNVNAIYAITPMSKIEALKQAESIKSMPISKWDMEQSFKNKVNELIENGQLRHPEEAIPELDSDFDSKDIDGSDDLPW